jgi:hypothetical protein
MMLSTLVTSVKTGRLAGHRPFRRLYPPDPTEAGIGKRPAT